MTAGRLLAKEWVIIAAICVLAVWLRWPSLDQPFDNDGGARAYHARLILEGEPLYSTHHPGHHLPAVYYTYATAFFLFGDSAWAVKFLLILWTIPTVYLLYRLGVLLVDESTGLLAAAFYAVLSAHLWLWGQTAETELFANLPRVAAVLVLMRLVRRQAAARQFVLVGLLSAVTFLFKVVYLSPLAMAGLVLLAQFWQNKTEPGALRQALARGAWVGVGFIAGLLPVIVYFSWLGLLPRLFLIFTLGQKYVGTNNIVSGAIPIFGPWILYVLLPLFGLAFNNAVLLGMSLAGFLLIMISRKRRSTPVVYIAAWYAFSFVEAGVNLELFVHYYLLIIPPLALLAAWFLLKIFRNVRLQIRWMKGKVASGFFVLLLAISLVISAVQNYQYYYHYVQYKVGQETMADFLRQGWPGFGERLARSLQLAEYIQARTSTADTIYYWSEDVQLYYLAERRSPIDTIWPVEVEATGSYERIFAPHTKYIIVDRRREPAAPDWLYAELSAQYVLETVMDEQEIYRRAD